jgi:hypothetical protein
MSQPFLRQPPKPKPHTDNGTYGVERKSSFLVSSDEEEDLQIMTLQILSPKLKADISFFNGTNEDISSITTQSPENLSDCEEEAKCSEHIKLQMARIKSESCQMKESQPMSNKGEPLSPMLKTQAKMAKIHPFRNLIHNPNCQKEVLKEHLKKVHSSLVYGVHHLKKPKDETLHTKFVCLGEQKDKNQKTLFLDLDETLIHSCMLNENPKYVVEGDIFQGDSAVKKLINIHYFI